MMSVVISRLSVFDIGWFSCKICIILRRLKSPTFVSRQTQSNHHLITSETYSEPKLTPNTRNYRHHHTVYCKSKRIGIKQRRKELMQQLLLTRAFESVKCIICCFNKNYVLLEKAPEKQVRMHGRFVRK